MTLKINGIIKGGKNNICITRTGHRFPKPAWAAWRDAQVLSIKSQLPRGFTTIAAPVNMSLYYTAGDKRRRDMPAVLDAIFHVLEKAGVVQDDTLIWVVMSWRGYDKRAPGAIITWEDSPQTSA